MQLFPRVCVHPPTMSYCCVLAVVAATLEPTIVSEPTIDAANRVCNGMVSAVNQGYVLSQGGPTTGPWRCQQCAQVVDSNPSGGGCDDGHLPNARLATSIYDRGDGDPTRRDYCSNRPGIGWECMACTKGRTTGPLVPPATALVHVSSSCHHVEPNGVALLDLGHPGLVVLGHGGVVQLPALPFAIGARFEGHNFTVCPLNQTTTDSCLANITLAGDGEGILPTALLLTAGPTLALHNIRSPATRSLVAIEPPTGFAADLQFDSIVIAGGGGVAFAATFSHVRCGTPFTVDCLDNTRVMVQARAFSTNPLPVQTNCRFPLHFGELMGAFGMHNQIELLHDGKLQNHAPAGVRLANQVLSYVGVALAANAIFGHEGDIRRLVAARRRRQLM
jgi:hypothetical protein